MCVGGGFIGKSAVASVLAVGLVLLGNCTFYVFSVLFYVTRYYNH